MNKNTYVGACCGFFFLSGNAAASGFAVEQQNAAAAGAAFAGAQAEAGDAGFAFYNPAAFGGIENFQASVNGTGLFIDTRYENAENTLFGGTTAAGLTADDGAIDDALVPSLAAAWRVSDNIVAGLTLTAPFGLISNYDEDSVLRFFGLETNLRALSLNPTVAVELTPKITIGGALRIQYLDFTVTNDFDSAGVLASVNIPGNIPGTEVVPSRLADDDIAIGYQIGIQAQLTEKTRGGLSFTSRIDHNLEGPAEFDLTNSPAGQTIAALVGALQPNVFSAEIPTPASIGIGLTHDVTDKFTLKASGVFTLWHSFEQFEATFENTDQPPEILTQDWRDVWGISVGGEYDISDRVSIRAGVFIDETPVNETFTSPRVPDADRIWLNAGFSKKISQRIGADFAAGYLLSENARVRQPAERAENAFRGAASADFETNALFVSLRLKYER